MRLILLLDSVQLSRASWQAATRLAGALADDMDVQLWALRGTPPARKAGGVKFRTFHVRNAGIDSAVKALAATHADVVVSTSLETLQLAATHLPRGTDLVHWERHRLGERERVALALPLFAGRLALVVAPDPATADTLRGVVGTEGAPVVEIPDPVEAGRLPQSTGRSQVIVAAGRLLPENGFAQLVTAFAAAAPELPGWRLRILGDGWHRPYLLAEARKSGVFDRVELPGLSAEMPLDWARGGIAVSPARAGLSLTVGEARAAGLPVIAVDAPDGARHQVEHETDGILVPPGPQHLRRELLRLGRDADLRDRIGKAAQESATRLAPEKVAPLWVRALSQGTVSPGAVDPAAPPVIMDPAEVAPSPLTPHEALQQTLGKAVLAAERRTGTWFVLRPLPERPTTLVVPEADRVQFLAELVATPGPELVVLDGPDALPTDPGRRLDDCLTDLQRSRSPILTISVPPTFAGRRTMHRWDSAVEIEFWDQVEGGLQAPRRNEWLATYRHGQTMGRTSVAGLDVPTPPLAAEPTIFDRPFPIDAVYTWVDGGDPAWQARRDAAIEQTTGLALSRAASGKARFVSRDELRYSMRSLHLFAPWINHIYLVTDGQVPDWLDADHPDVTVVPHREILAAENLPTFNSHAIESGLHRIPGLSEHFIYFNDDVLLGRTVHPSRFFSAAGQFAAFVGSSGFGDDPAEALPFQRAAFNNRALLRERFGVVTTRVMRHTPHPLTRSVLAEIADTWPDAVARTASAPFRSETDLSIASSLAQHYGLLTGAAVEGELEFLYVGLTAPMLEPTLNGLLRREREAMCVADFHDWAFPENAVQQRLHQFFEEYFPVTAPWER